MRGFAARFWFILLFFGFSVSCAQMYVGCQPGTLDCINDTTFHYCNSYALWDEPQDCPAGQLCSGGKCYQQPKECDTYQQTRCSPGDPYEVQICNAAYRWENFRRCDYGCLGGYCRACRPGASRCADSYSYQACDSDGNWGPSSRCSRNYVCDMGSCIISPLVSCTSPGAFRCSPDNSQVLQRCGDNRQWADFSYCDMGCFSSACRACSTGQSKCQDSQTTLRCTSSGQWGLATSCPDGQFCFSGSCQVPTGSQCPTPGQKRCSPDNPAMVQKCSNGYSYQDYVACNDGCFDGNCAECKPGTSLCTGPSTYRICTQSGQLSGEKSCQQGYTCDSGQCVATPQCSDGQRNCVSDTIYSCVSGQWQLLYICPPDSDCKESSGTAYCAPEVRPAKNETAPIVQPPQPQKQEAGLGGLGTIFAATTALLAVAVIYLVFLRKK